MPKQTPAPRKEGRGPGREPQHGPFVGGRLSSDKPQLAARCEEAVKTRPGSREPALRATSSAQPTNRHQEVSMKTHVAGTAFAVLVGLASLAQAGQLLSPPLPTPTRETNVTTYGACRIRNTGTKPLPVKVSLFGNNATVGDIDVCNGPALAAGHTCLVTAFLPDDSYVACKVTGDVTTLRGTLELVEFPNHGGSVFTAVDL